MKDFFKELFEYSYHFNQRLWDIFNENPDKTSERSVKLYNHILNAHQIWNNRVNPMQPPYEVWQIHLIQNCKDIDKTNYEHSLLILDKFDLNDIVNYKNTKGQVFNNSIRDALFHVINHSTYHRGQIAADFRQNKMVPFVTDYIFYKR
ncbi:DinB family protein [Agriterribacter sp.]|uniref:DinB family protein n=1 Tax=Agriterribacter sp. TaxID=2821509 RepID=UPI002D1B542C|nr:DinB family protein [Agriterribacter sp.]HRO45183.1 DinB family protein [Agriterribacter sp.]HRQ17788.1 DinB family protein [Agriterribacter sp.]